MLMSVPIIPSPSSSATPMAEAPRTPVSPPMALLAVAGDQQQSQSQAQRMADSPSDSSAAAKRKPSKRANTAERRATHNAVERARRETLNGRFMDLAAVLPNLSQIRRPSKSSIVNSSIAHVHASRRHRLLASRELRNIKHETDALRRELNEWRTRAGLPRIEEPARGEGFAMILSAELEVISCVPTNEDEDDESFSGYGYEDEYAHGDRHPMSAGLSMIKNVSANPFAHNLPPAHSNLPPSISRHASHGGPIMNSSAYGDHVYEQNQAHLGEVQFMQQQQSDSKWSQMYNGMPTPQHQVVMAQRSLYTPPASSHGIPSAPPSSSGNTQGSFVDHQTYFLNMQRQQQLASMHQQKQQQPQQPARVYGSPEAEEQTNEESRRRERSSSLSNGYDSPIRSTTAGTNYEVPTTPPVGAITGDYAVPRRSSAPSWGSSDIGMMKQNPSAGFSLMI